jgi:hypothetical protein
MSSNVLSNLDNFIDNTYIDGELTKKTFSDLRSTFAQYGHQPSEAMWAAVRALLQTLEDMANGNLDRLAYLSSLDPGVGKTETVAHFIKNLVASPLRIRTSGF